MKNKRRSSGPQSSLGRFLYSAVTVFLLLIFLTAMAGGIFRIRDRLSSDEYDYYDEASYLNRLRNEDYAGLLEMTRDDSRADKVYKGDIPECRAVAMYYDAAVFFHAFEKAGDAENVVPSAPILRQGQPERYPVRVVRSFRGPDNHHIQQDPL